MNWLFQGIFSGKLFWKINFFKDLESLKVKGGEEGVWFMHFKGKKLLESIAESGLTVMNTQKKIDSAYIQLKEG